MNNNEYLHHYLGCYGKLEKGGYCGTPYIDSDYKLTPNLLHFILSTNGVKFTPYLRLLSDMTTDEVHEFVLEVMRIQPRFYLGGRLDYKIEKGFLHYVHDKDEINSVIIKNWSENGDGEWIFNCSYTMYDVVWLLKRNFDIFGLIGKGMAFDKTKINQPA